MGASGSTTNNEELEWVTFSALMKDEKAWDSKMESNVCDCLHDGKLLADFAWFLKERHPELAVQLWALDLARCALRPDEDDIECSRTVADDLQAAWNEYLEDPTGKLNLDDVSEFKKFRLGQVRDEEKTPTEKTLVDSQNEMYQFACQAMFGIHSASVCQAFIQDALAEGIVTEDPDGDALESWAHWYPNNDLIDSLQRSYRKFVIPPEGSAYSPECRAISNGYVDDEFLFEEFCPQLFAQTRAILGISNEEYFHSLCRTDFEFISFGTNSKSGEFFFFSHDNKFLLKTTTQEEAEMLMTMLPDFLGRHQTTPHTFLGKYLGLYRLGKRLFFVMRSVTTHNMPITRIYDLKGALKNRDAPATDGIGMDFNFLREIGEIKVDLEVAMELAQTHKDDLQVLKQHTIMDFSLLVQVHDTQVEQPAKSETQGVTASSDAGPDWLDNTGIFENARSVDIAFEDSYRSESSKTEVDWRPDTGIWSEDGRYLFTFGLIDILVPYTLKPKVQYCVEQICSCGHGSDYSRIPPDYYCDRQVEMFHQLLGVGPVVE